MKYCLKKVCGKDKTANIFMQDVLLTYFPYIEVYKLGETLALVR